MRGIVGRFLKHLMSNDYGPADRVLEALVFLLILWEVVAGIVRSQKEKKRKRFVEAKRRAIYEFAKRGEALQVSMPLGPTEAVKQDQEKWVNEVDTWSSETETFLGKLCSRASWRFMQVANPGSKDVMVRLPNGESHCVYNFAALICYRGLVVKLGNLHGIIENVEAYL